MNDKVPTRGELFVAVSKGTPIYGKKSGQRVNFDNKVYFDDQGESFAMDDDDRYYFDVPQIYRIGVCPPTKEQLFAAVKNGEPIYDANTGVNIYFDKEIKYDSPSCTYALAENQHRHYFDNPGNYRIGVCPPPVKKPNLAFGEKRWQFRADVLDVDFDRVLLEVNGSPGEKDAFIIDFGETPGFFVSLKYYRLIEAFESSAAKFKASEFGKKYFLLKDITRGEFKALAKRCREYADKPVTVTVTIL